MKSKTPHQRIRIVIPTPLAYAWLFAAWFIDTTARLLDTVLHTHLRTLKITPEQVENLINTHIPPGSTSAEIFSFLELHKIRHPDQVFGPFDYDLHDLPDFKKRELYEKKAVIKKFIVASIDNVGKSLLGTDDISIKFYLDEQDNLVEYVVDVIANGL